MKYVLIFSFIAFVAALDGDYKKEFVEEVNRVGNKCVGEVNSTPDELKQLLAHNIPQSHEGKCLVFCIYKHYQVQREDGSINPEGVLKSLEKMKIADPDLFDKIVKIAITCGKKVAVDPDPCIFAAALAQCAVDEAVQMGISPDIFEL